MRKNKKLIIALLLVVVVGMGVGYSILSKQLKIEGTATLNTLFDVGITDFYGYSENQSGLENRETYLCIGDSCSNQTYNLIEVNEEDISHTSTTASFTVALTSGTKSIYEVNISNMGNIDAIVDKVHINYGTEGVISMDAPINISGAILKPGNQISYPIIIYAGNGEENIQETKDISITFDFKQVTTETETNSTAYNQLFFGERSENYFSIVSELNPFNYDNSAKTLETYISINSSEYQLLKSQEFEEGTLPGGSMIFYDDLELNSGLNEIKIKTIYGGIESNEIILDYYN